jgi:hypothetical protein
VDSETEAAIVIPDEAESDRRTQDRFLWAHILKRLHGQLVAFIEEPAETRHLDIAFEFLISAAALGSDVQAMAPAYLTTASAFLEQAEQLEKVQGKISTAGPFSAAEWIYLSYLANIADLLRHEWEEFYESAPLPEDVRKQGRAVLDLTGKVSFPQALQLLEKQWEDSALDLKTETAALLYVRACAMMDTYADASLYTKIAERLSVTNHFLVVYLAACCLKRAAVSARVEVSSWTDSQYACLMLMDTFFSLYGAAWG